MQQGSDILTWIKKPYVQISHGFLFPTGWALHLWGSTAVAAQEMSFILWLHFDMCSPPALALECSLEKLFAGAEHIAAPGIAYPFHLQHWNIPGVILFPHPTKLQRKDGNFSIYKPTSLPMPILVPPRVTENN